MAGSQAAHCDYLGGAHGAWQACSGHPPAPVNRPLFLRLGPHPALRRSSPGSESGSLPAGWATILSSGHLDSAGSCHQHLMDRGSDPKARGKGEQSRPGAFSVKSKPEIPKKRRLCRGYLGPSQISGVLFMASTWRRVLKERASPTTRPRPSKRHLRVC